MVQEYTSYCHKATTALIWRELGLDNVIVIQDELGVAVQHLQPTTPPLPTDAPGSSAGQALTPGTSSGQAAVPISRSERASGPSPSLKYCSSLPPGMENCPNFDRRMYASSHEILLRNTTKMTEDELRIAVEQKLWKIAD